MLIGAALNWSIYKYVMMPLHIGFLKIVIFIGVIAAFVQAADTIMKKVTPALYYKLGIYLALITTNCIILAVPLLNADEYSDSLFKSMALALGSGLGFQPGAHHHGQHPGKTRTGRCAEIDAGSSDLVRADRA